MIRRGRDVPTLGGALGDVGRGPGGRAVPLRTIWGPSLQRNQGVSQAEVPKASQNRSTEQWSRRLGDRGREGRLGTAGAPVRWPGLGPTSTTCCLSDPGRVTLTPPVSVSSTVKCRRPNASGRAAVSLRAGAIPQCVGGAHTRPAAKPPSTTPVSAPPRRGQRGLLRLSSSPSPDTISHSHPC